LSTPVSDVRRGFFSFTLTLPYVAITLETLCQGSPWVAQHVLQEKEAVTKKEIVKQISERIGLTQLKTKEIVQLTFDAIVDTLLADKRIELRNFGVFEVKQRKARKARNPRTGEKVDVPPKNVVTFKPGKEMEERVRQMTDLTSMDDDEESLVGDGVGKDDNGEAAPTHRMGRSRKAN